MTTENDDFKKGLVAAVQAELERHASAVVAEVDRLRVEGRRERANLREEIKQSVAQLVDAVDRGRAEADAESTRSRESLEQRVFEAEAESTRARGALEQRVFEAEADATRARGALEQRLIEVEADATRTREALEQRLIEAEAESTRTREALEQRLADSESRQTRRVDDVSAGVEGVVAEAVRPVVSELRAEYDALSHKVDGFDTSLRRFDEQAARMVTYFNEVTASMEAKQDELSATLQTEVTAKVDELKQLVEENDSAIRRFQNEVGQSVSAKVNDAEDRFNNRLLAAESRMKEDSGAKIADIQAHVGRVSAGLDDTMNVLNERVARVDDLIVETDRRIDALAESVKDIDQDALDDLKDKMSSAAGEAMLVRIEMERMEKSVAERTDTLSVRMTDVETQLQDATMDVSTAVQLDRLEEIERSLLELPNVFVQRDDTTGSGPDEREKSVKNAELPADDTSSFDPSAILSAEQSRHEDQT